MEEWNWKSVLIGDLKIFHSPTLTSFDKDFYFRIEPKTKGKFLHYIVSLLEVDILDDYIVTEYLRRPFKDLESAKDFCQQEAARVHLSIKQ